MSIEADADAGRPASTGDRNGWFRQAGAFAGRDLRELVRNKAVLFWSLGFPAGFYLLTVAVFIPAGQVPDDAMPTVKAGTAVGYGIFGATIVCLNAFGQHLVSDLEDRRYVQFRSLPIFPSADLAGRTVAALSFAFVAFGFVLAVSVATGAAYALRSLVAIPVVLGALALSSVLWLVVALAIAVLVRDARYANIISISVAMVAYFLTGYNGTSPNAFTADPELLNLIPNSLAARIVVYNLVDASKWATTGLKPPGMPSDPAYLGLLAAYAVVCGLVGVALMRSQVYVRGVLR